MELWFSKSIPFYSFYNFISIAYGDIDNGLIFLTLEELENQ